MDQRASWLWRKKTSEKTIVATNKFDTPEKGNGEDTQDLTMRDEVRPVRPVNSLNEKLGSVFQTLDCDSEDELVTKHKKLAQEAIAGREKVEAELACLKKELEEAQRQEAATNDRLTHSGAALKQCIQQLSSFPELQEQKVHDAVKNVSIEFEKVQKRLEEKLIETSKRLTNVAIENTNLSNVLIVKEKFVEELHKRAAQTVAEFNALMSRLDSTEKENAFLKYEFHMLEKELQVRNEELEYNRRSADMSRRQHLESVRKISKLEAECQRLRLLMRKKLPGTAALAKMRSELEIQCRDPVALKRNPNPTRDLILRDTTMEQPSEIPIKNVNFLIEQLRGMEEENKSLKDLMIKKNDELQSSRRIFSRTASRLSQVEARLIEISEGHKSMELEKCSQVSNELFQSPTAGFEIGSDDGGSSSGSWANALMSESEHFRGVKAKSPSERIFLEMQLMDDFVEMEKLAVVSAQTPPTSGKHPLAAGRELFPVMQGDSHSSNNKQDPHSHDVAAEQSFDWLQVVLNAMFKAQRISKRNLYELLEDIKIALGYINHPNLKGDISTIPHAEPEISGYITWRSPKASTIDSLEEPSCIDSPLKEVSKRDNRFNLSKSICKLIQLIEVINLEPIVTDDTTDARKRDQTSSATAAPADYFIQVFQWRRSELSEVLQKFVKTCNGLLNGKVGFDNFAEELGSTLDWIVSNYVIPKDDSTARDRIKKHFGWNESEIENGVGSDLVGYDPIHMSKEQSSLSRSAASSHGQNIPFPVHNSLQEENKRLKDELNTTESAKRDTESRLLSAADKIESLMMQFRESQKGIELLQSEVETLKQSKGMIEEQLENQKSVNEDLDTQLSMAKAKLNDALQKYYSLEVELDDKHSCCEELEATCLELQLQLESLSNKEPMNCGIDAEGKQSQNDWEMAAASVKLAQCQDTILNLGKQLKALATPREAALFDQVFNTTSSTTNATTIRNLNRRFSLRDQMIAEDRSKAIILRSHIEKEEKTSENHSDDDNTLTSPNIVACNSEQSFAPNQHKTSSNPSAGQMAIVPVRKQGVGFLRRLLMRRNKGGSKKSRTPGKDYGGGELGENSADD